MYGNYIERTFSVTKTKNVYLDRQCSRTGEYSWIPLSYQEYRIDGGYVLLKANVHWLLLEAVVRKYPLAERS